MCNILIVDDDVDTRETLAEGLTEQGHCVWLATNGCHALELLELGRSMGADACLALVDLTMPVMDGWALLAALDRDGSWRKLQVIVSSGADLSERPLSFAHAVVLWPKPIDFEKLEHIWRRCPVHGSTSNAVAAAEHAIASTGEKLEPSPAIAPRTAARGRSPRPVRSVVKAGRKRGAPTH